MKKWIRWQGIVAFLVIIVVLLGFFFLFADTLVKKGIEAAGTKAVGAKVELADVTISLSPAGGEIKGLQVTNPSKPMENAVEVASIRFLLDAPNLFQRKIVIKEMGADGVLFNTQRKHSGAVKTQEKQSKKTESQKALKKEKWLPTFDIKDIQSILQKEKLVTLEEVKKLEAEINQGQKTFEKKLHSLPNRKTFEQYKVRVEKLQSGSKGIQGIIGKARDIPKLKTDIEKDINKIKNAEKDLNKTMVNLKKRIKNVSQGPSKDFHRLKKKYGITSQGLGNMTGLIFGPEYSVWVTKGLYWYGKLRPILEQSLGNEGDEEAKEPERGKGMNIRFKEDIPVPDFLIKNANISLEIPAGEIAGEIKNITKDQHITGLPLTCELSGKKLEKFESIYINGTFNHVVPSRTEERIKGTIAGYRVQDMPLSDSEELSLALKKARVDINFQASIKGNHLDSNMTFNLSSVSLSSDKTKNPNQVSKAIGSALANVSSFSVSAKIIGPLNNYDVKLTSDLDKVINKAIYGLVRQLQADFQKRLNKEIVAKTNGPLKSLTSDLGGYNQIKKELNNRSNSGKNILRDLKKLM